MSGTSQELEMSDLRKLLEEKDQKVKELEIEVSVLKNQISGALSDLQEAQQIFNRLKEMF